MLIIAAMAEPALMLRMKSKSRRVLITGGAGFIGSHLVEGLLKQGDELQVLDNLDDFYSPSIKQSNLKEAARFGSFDFAEVDICDWAGLRNVFVRARPEVVIHLAARAGVRPSIELPRLYEQVNVGGTTNLLDLCREFEVQKFIFGSSSSVYGVASRIPFSEDLAELKPISPYAATKLAGEMLCYTYSHLFGMPVICLRFFTVYGPRQRPDLAIHRFTSLLEKGKPIPIFGDGSAGRDYTHVSDIVAGILSAVDFNPRADGRTPFEVFNLGNSHPVKLVDLVDTLERLTGRKATCERQPAQPGDVVLTWADISKATRLLNYLPAMTLEEGLKQFVKWHRSCFSQAHVDHPDWVRTS